jgi:hypothetical protein
MAVASDTEIMNSALIKLGAERIISANDENNRARLCKEQYPKVRDDLLRAHPWKFSVRRVSLTAIDPKPAGYGDYAYVMTLPSDCIRVLELVNCNINEVWDTEDRYLLVNYAPVTLRYISRVTNVAKYDDNFCEVLAWQLAADLAYALVGDKEKADGVKVMAERALSQARSFNAQQGSVKRFVSDNWKNARRY